MKDVDIKALILIVLALVMVVFLGLVPLIAYVSVLLINYIFNTLLTFSYFQYVAMGILILIIKYVFFESFYNKKEK